MRRRFESVLPAVVLAGFLIAAIVVTLLVNDAEDRGLGALEDSVLTEVNTVAAGMGQRFGGQLESTSSALLGFDFEATVGSSKDRDTLDELNDLLGPALNAGFYVTTLDGVVANGVGLRDAAIGEPAGIDGFADVLADPNFLQKGYARILPVGPGLTSAQPVQISVIPILSGPPDDNGRAIGAFMVEAPVVSDNQFNGEVRALRRGQTGTYLVYDENGTVLAGADPTSVAKPVGPELRAVEPGLHRQDGLIVVVAPLEGLGWTVVLTQAIDEFEEPLVGPLQTAGTVLIIALLGAGFVMTWMLARRLRSARAEQGRLAQISATQQELISIVSHELRTPVAGVLGFLETSLDHWDGMDDIAKRSAVARAAANARRLQAMARDVLDTQTLEAGNLVQVLDRVDLAAEVRDAVEAVRGLDGERKFAVDLPEEPVWVSADSDRIQQVLANLLDNAAKNAPVVAPIEISLVGGEGEAVVTVHDHGPGITEEARERIFDKFVRGRGESVTGTGLGLYISRQIITAHGGRIWAESEPGEGATFRFSLPEAAPVGPSESSSGEVVTT